MTRERGENPSIADMSNDFVNLSDSEFAEKLKATSDRPIIIKIPVSILGANIFRDRMKRFLEGRGGNQPRRVIVEARQSERDTFEKNFPGVEWKITDINNK